VNTEVRAAACSALARALAPTTLVRPLPSPRPIAFALVFAFAVDRAVLTEHPHPGGEGGALAGDKKNAGRTT